MSTYGIEEFERKLLNLAGKKYPQETRRFIRKLARKVVVAARKRTPRGETGNLRKGWGVGRVYIRENGVWAVIRNTAPHAHLVEQGHTIRRVKGGPILGRVAPSRFFERAIEVNEQHVNKEVLEFLDKMLKEYRL